MPIVRGVLLTLIAALVTACAVGPNYKRPPFTTTAAFKEENGWKPTEPADALDRGPWWHIYNDDVLNGLEEQLDISNENIKAAAAAYEEARALVSQARAGLWPSVSLGAGRERTQTGNLRPHIVNSLDVTGSWDIDIWGQVRRSLESNRDTAQSSEALLASARLSAEAALASDYFQLRAQDQLQIILDDIVAAEEQSLKITENRYRVGVAAKADVVTARTQLLSSQSQQAAAPLQRALLEHAIAVLLGRQPGDFSLQPAAMRSDVPTVPAGLPSVLLERRPDIAGAERKVAAANAQIGVAVSAWFPSLTLTGSDDYSGSTISHLIRTANRVWAYGPTVALSVFDGGLRRAQLAQARAGYEITVDDYRQTVLTAIQQVEDELVTLRVLERQAVIEDETVKAAREAETLTLNQYKAGTVPYSSVITAQTTRLSSEETALNVLSGRLQASVAMVEALGGGWNAASLK
ncbi:MAG TPA: efflux transporter outer membrane subunit [Steroidobacteraceae bacterium]|nr:efflux transporter outer membrane subunit [Steroidobacteraceae bacterium]